jgi:hypothetical protein
MQEGKSNLCPNTGRTHSVYCAFNKRFVYATNEIKANEFCKITYLLSLLLLLNYVTVMFLLSSYFIKCYVRTFLYSVSLDLNFKPFSIGFYPFCYISCHVVPYPEFISGSCVNEIPCFA